MFQKRFTALTAGSIVALALVAARPALPQGMKVMPQGIIRIDIGEESSGADRALARRVWRLEQAVRQLQDRVFELELRGNNNDRGYFNPPAKEYSCYLKDTFRGTFTGKGATQNEAKAKAMQACESGGGSFCNERDVKCGE